MPRVATTTMRTIDIPTTINHIVRKAGRLVLVPSTKTILMITVKCCFIKEEEENMRHIRRAWIDMPIFLDYYILCIKSFESKSILDFLLLLNRTYI